MNKTVDIQRSVEMTFI